MALWEICFQEMRHDWREELSDHSLLWSEFMDIVREHFEDRKAEQEDLCWAQFATIGG